MSLRLSAHAGDSVAAEGEIGDLTRARVELFRSWHQERCGRWELLVKALGGWFGGQAKTGTGRDEGRDSMK